VLNLEDRTGERNLGSAMDHHIKLPNLSFKARKHHEIDQNYLPNNAHLQNYNPAFMLSMNNIDDKMLMQHDNEESSIERLPTTKSRVKASRNSKMHKSRSMLNKNDDSVGPEDEVDRAQPKRKIKIIQNSKGSKQTRIKNSHMVILKSIKQKLNMQGVEKDNE
jgi:hypothetical protein